MSAVRKIVVSVVTLLLGLSALFMTTGTAAAECDWNTPVPCKTAGN
jgi:hypothetical protein